MAHVLRIRRETKAASKELCYPVKMAAWQQLLLQKADQWRQEYLMAQQSDAANKDLKDASPGKMRELTLFQHLLAESAVPLWFWQEAQCGKLAQKVIPKTDSETHFCQVSCDLSGHRSVMFSLKGVQAFSGVSADG